MSKTKEQQKCPRCGTELTHETRLVPALAAQGPVEVDFCWRCGWETATAYTPPTTATEG